MHLKRNRTIQNSQPFLLIFYSLYFVVIRLPKPLGCNVLPVLHALKSNGLHALVGPVDSFLEGSAGSCGSNDTATASLKLAILENSASVEYDDVLAWWGELHRGTLGVAVRVAASCNDDGCSRLVGDVDGQRGE